MSVDRTADLVKIRIDEVEEASGDISTATGSLDTSAALTIGARSNGDVPYAGQIDEVRMWDDVRTPAEFDDNNDAEVSEAEAGVDRARWFAV